MLDCAKHLGGVIVAEQEEQEHEVCFCCEEYWALVAQCNGIIEWITDMAEFDTVTTGEDHVRLRYEIMEHECGGDE